jgi:hypothetical protein
MSADLNLIANQANSLLIPFQERAREAETVPRRPRHRFAGRLRQRHESASLASGIVILRNDGSTSNRRILSNAPSVRLDESSSLTNPSDWSSLKIEPLAKSVDELGEDIIKIIGENGIQRFEQFKKLTEGWEFGTEKPLSAHSIASFKLFSEQFSEPLPNEPSLFLTREGNLQLGWEDNDGNKIELEFFADKIEYYIEARDDEGEVAF